MHKLKNKVDYIRWMPLNSPLVKLNFDGYVKDQNQGAYGFVIRDFVGIALVAGAKQFNERWCAS